MDYDSTKDLIQSILRKDDAILPERFWIIDLDPDHSKGTQSTKPLFSFTCKSWAIILHSEHVEMREISEKLLKIIITITLSGTQLLISMALNMAEAV